MINPNLNAKPKATRARRPWRWPLFAALAVGGSLAHAQDNEGLPDLGDSSARMLSVEQEQEYAGGLLRQLRNYDLNMRTLNSSSTWKRWQSAWCKAAGAPKRTSTSS